MTFILPSNTSPFFRKKKPEILDTLTYAKSLLFPIPVRDCFSCGIPNNWCLCHKWNPVPKDFPTNIYGNFVIKKLNEFVLEGKSVCQKLVLKEVISIQVNMDVVLPTYRMEFSVVAPAPRSMTFLAFVTRLESDELWLDQWDITQVTAWGKFVKCRPDKVRPPIEGQFCICK